jgi:hypothetical protein
MAGRRLEQYPERRIRFGKMAGSSPAMTIFF